MHKRNVIKILFLPLLAPILLTGLILSLVGEPRAKASQKPITTQTSQRSELEMGLINDFNNDLTITA
ncbi:MAG: hypothetical protein GX638_06035 [Crenarchaeota archaeon]|nr:hypothetical protein [Thermoproteota archaeon]